MESSVKKRIVLAGKYALLCDSKLESFIDTLKRVPPVHFRIPTMAELKSIHRNEKKKLLQWYDGAGLITDFCPFSTNVKVSRDSQLYIAVLGVNSGGWFWADARSSRETCPLFIAETRDLHGDFTIL